MNTNSNSSLPTLRSGVSWRNPEEIPLDRIPAGYRLLTSAETGVPQNSSITFSHGRSWSELGPGRPLPASARVTYITSSPLPPEALPTPELPTLRAGVTWHNPCWFSPDKFGVADGWRPLCSLDDPAPADVQYYDLFACAWCVAAFTSGTPKERWSKCLENYRTKAPIPQPKPLQFPELPAGVSWHCLGTHVTPELVGVAEGWRPLCTLDKAVPVGAEWYRRLGNSWEPTADAGSGFLSSILRRTKNPIPELSWPELPAGERYFNPQNLTPADLGFGYRPLCTLDETYPADHEYQKIRGGDCWALGTPCTVRPGKGTARTYRTKAPIPQPKPVEHVVNLVHTPGESTCVRVGGTRAVLTLDNHAPECLDSAEQQRVRDLESALELNRDTTSDLRRCLDEAHATIGKQQETLGDLGAALCDARSTDPATLVLAAKRARNQVTDLRGRIGLLDNEASDYQGQLNEIAYIACGRHSGDVERSSDVVKKVYALHKMKTAAEFQVADLEKANAAQTEVLDTIAKMVGDTSGTLESILPAVRKAVLDESDRKFKIAVQDIEACQRIYGDLPGTINGAMSQAFHVAANIVRRVSKS